MGLVFGWLRSVYPFFGRIPEPAIWIFDTLGLCMFIAVVGLSAGPSFISGLQTTGLTLVAVGLVSALLPHTIGKTISVAEVGRSAYPNASEAIATWGTVPNRRSTSPRSIRVSAEIGSAIPDRVSLDKNTARAKVA